MFSGSSGPTILSVSQAAGLIENEPTILLDRVQQCSVEPFQDADRFGCETASQLKRSPALIRGTTNWIRSEIDVKPVALRIGINAAHPLEECSLVGTW